MASLLGLVVASSNSSRLEALMHRRDARIFCLMKVDADVLEVEEWMIWRLLIRRCEVSILHSWAMWSPAYQLISTSNIVHYPTFVAAD